MLLDENYFVRRNALSTSCLKFFWNFFYRIVFVWTYPTQPPLPCAVGETTVPYMNLKTSDQ